MNSVITASSMFFDIGGSEGRSYPLELLPSFN